MIATGNEERGERKFRERIRRSIIKRVRIELIRLRGRDGIKRWSKSGKRIRRIEGRSKSGKTSFSERKRENKEKDKKRNEFHIIKE